MYKPSRALYSKVMNNNQLAQLQSTYPGFTQNQYQSVIDYLVYGHSQDGELVDDNFVINEMLTGYDDLTVIPEMLAEQPA